MEIKSISNANVYVEGGSLLGKCEKVKLPDVSFATDEVKPLGLVGAFEVPTGLEKMEGEIVWISYYPGAAPLYANPWKTHKIQIRSSSDTHDDNGLLSRQPMVTHMNCAFKKSAMGEYEQNKGARFTSSFSCTYIKQVLDGKDMLEIDVLNNIYRVEGEDMLAEYRENIGG